MTLTLRQLAGAIPLFVAVAGEAHATQNVSCGGSGYYDPCDGVDGWSEFALLSGGTIPVDGVLVLQGTPFNQQPGLETISLTVTTDDVPLAGVIEATQFPGLVIWRPSMPWTAGATYQITGTVDNPDVAGECMPADIPLSGEVTIDAAPGAALMPVVVDAKGMVELIPTISLETLACCEGVSPQLIGGGCYSDSVVQFDPMQCAPIAGVGHLQLTLTGTPAAEGPVDQQIIYILKADGFGDQHAFSPMFGLDDTAPLCATIDAIDLGSGVTVPGAEACFGDMVADQLGPQVIDPAETLTCDLQTCAVNSNGDMWDLGMCVPFGPGGAPTTGPTSSGGDGTGSEASGASEASGDGTGGQDGDKGCACDASGADTSGSLALVGLALLARRRRRG
jgi:MYXO-CTERM domain-containing protein